jgi:hypothetical protein
MPWLLYIALRRALGPRWATAIALALIACGWGWEWWRSGGAA